MEQFSPIETKETQESSLRSLIINHLELGEIVELKQFIDSVEQEKNNPEKKATVEKVMHDPEIIQESSIARGMNRLLAYGKYELLLVMLMSFPALGRRAEALLVRAPEQFEESIAQGVRMKAGLGKFRELHTLFSIPGVGHYALSILKEELSSQKNESYYDVRTQTAIKSLELLQDNRFIFYMLDLKELFALPVLGERAEIIAQDANLLSDAALAESMAYSIYSLDSSTLSSVSNLPGIGERVREIFQSNVFQEEVASNITSWINFTDNVVYLFKIPATKTWISEMIEKYVTDEDIQNALISCLADGEFSLFNEVCALPGIGSRVQKIFQDGNEITGELLKKGIMRSIKYAKFEELAALCENSIFSRIIQANQEGEQFINPIVLQTHFDQEEMFDLHIHAHIAKILVHPALGSQMLSGLEQSWKRGEMAGERVRQIATDALNEGNIIFVNALSSSEVFKAFIDQELALKTTEQLRGILGLFIKQEMPIALITDEILHGKIQNVRFFNRIVSDARGDDFLTDAEINKLEQAHQKLLNSKEWKFIREAHGQMDFSRVSSSLEIEPSIALSNSEVYEQQYNPSTTSGYLKKLLKILRDQNRILLGLKLTNKNVYDSLHLCFGVRKEEQFKLERRDNEIRALMNFIQLIFNPVNRTHYILSTPEHRNRLVTCGDVKSGIQGEYDAVFQLRGLCLMHGATSFDIRFLSSLERYVKKLIKSEDISYLAEDIKALLSVVKHALKAAEEMIKEEDPNYVGILLGEGGEACDGDMWLHLRAVRGEFKEREAGKSASGIFAMGKDVNDRNSILGLIKSVLDSRTNT